MGGWNTAPRTTPSLSLDLGAAESKLTVTARADRRLDHLTYFSLVHYRDLRSIYLSLIGPLGKQTSAY
jgi:hypothetical protein